MIVISDHCTSIDQLVTVINAAHAAGIKTVDVVTTDELIGPSSANLAHSLMCAFEDRPTELLLGIDKRVVVGIRIQEP